MKKTNKEKTENFREDPPQKFTKEDSEFWNKYVKNKKTSKKKAKGGC